MDPSPAPDPWWLHTAQPRSVTAAAGGIELVGIHSGEDSRAALMQCSVVYGALQTNPHPLAPQFADSPPVWESGEGSPKHPAEKTKDVG
jgi:hypothetical protein